VVDGAEDKVLILVQRDQGSIFVVVDKSG